MKSKTTKRILSLLMTVLMLLSSATMLFAHAEEGAEHTCADVSPKDHYCDDATCGKAINSTLVNFTGTNTDVVTYKNGGLRFDGTGKGNLSAVKDMGFAAFPLLDHKYEITYWFESNSSARAALSMYYQGARYGWGLRGTTNNQVLWYQNGTPKATVTTPVRDVDDNGRSYYKVIFDGFNNTMSLYVLSGGEYKRADTRAITVTASSKLYFYLFCYDTLATGQYMEYGDLTINTLCVDTNKDHNCDYCGEVCSDCSDATSDNDHKCDECGADKVTECTDVANDGDHKCDECGADNITVCADVANDGDHKCDECGADNITVCADVANDGDHKCDECGADGATECKNEVKDHNCDTDSKCRAYKGCKDANTDTVCDVCNQPMHDCIDEKINDLDEPGKDHICDICEDSGIGTHADSNSDKDHLCDECGEFIAGEACVDTEPKDHKCDYCGENVNKKVVDFSSKEDTDVITYKEGGLRYDGAGAGNINANLALKAADYPLPGHKYEITYWFEGNSSDRAALSMYYQGARWGWGLRGTTNNQVIWYQNGTPQSTVTVPVRDVDENGRSHYKVILDGIENTISIYVRSGGQYKLADTRDITLTASSYLYFYLFCYDTLAVGEYMEYGDLTILPLCSDADKDHRCEYCENAISECSDANNDGDHKCDYCAKEDITECFDAENDGNHKCDDCRVDGITECTDLDNDGDHKCDECGAEGTTECKNENNDHVCDTDSECDAVRYCVDENADTKCDICGEPMHECADVKVNETQADGKDHLCDKCGKPGQGTHADSNTDKDHLCDECGEFIAGEACVDADPKDHKCDLCGENINKTIVDFSGAADTDVITYNKGGIRYDGAGAGNINASLALKASDYPLVGRKYEITYWFSGNSNDRAALSMYYQGGRWGWGLRGTSDAQAIWYKNGTPQATVATPLRDVDDDGRSYYKVIFDGIENKISLYVLSGGEYKLADSRDITVTDASYLFFYLFCFDSLAVGEYMEYGDLTVLPICYDADKNHICDYCEAIISECADDATDGDHKCDYCGKDEITKCSDASGDGDHKCDDCKIDGITLCADVNDDGDHKCDECGAENTTECKNDVKDHVCDTDSKCDAVRYCIDEDADTKCDICGDKMHDCYDEKINATNEAGKDHLCDKCGKPGQGTHADSGTDKDHLCDECGEFIAGEACVDTEPKDHFCDYCGKGVASTVVDFTGNGLGTFTGGNTNTEYTVSEDGRVLSVTKAPGAANRNIGIRFSTSDFPVLGHKYEITYWMKDTTNTGNWQMFNLIPNQGYATRNQAGYEKQLGYARHQSSGPVVALTASDAQKADENGIRYFKIIIDGIENKITAYLKVGDEYVKIDSRSPYGDITEATYFWLNLRLYYGFTEGELAVGDVTITELCVDSNEKDHACDYCGASIAEHSAKLGKHDCTYCGKPVTECRDGASLDHICEICYKVMPSLHKDENKDHFCDLCTDIRMSYCADENADQLCDHCGVSMVHEEVDANKDHLCDKCGATVGEHIIADGKHVCDYCGIGSDKVIDFSAETSADQNADELYALKLEDGVRLLGLKGDGIATSLGVQLKASEYPLLGRQYEVFFYLSMSKIEQRIGFSIVKDNDGKSLGWITMGGNTNQLKRLWDTTVLPDTISAERDCGENNRQDFKVLVDGINHKLVIYVMKDGEYVKVDEMDHIFDGKDYFMIRMFYEARLRTADYIEMRGVTIRELCSDVDPRNHKCDVCGARVGICYDFSMSDGDHNCDICGKPSVNSECSNFNKDHKCDTDSACTAYAGCHDDNGDHRCDVNYCETLFGDHVDNNKDHFCDGCPDIRMNGFCVDENGDKLCDYCEKAHEETDRTGDHKCDFCDAEIPHYEGKVVDHKCELCGELVPEFHEDKDPADHFCDECGNIRMTECGIDENGDKKCDVCGISTEHQHVDEKINSTLKTGKDHLCDICGNGGVGIHADSDTDEDLVCDHCGAAMNQTVVDFTSKSDAGVIDYRESGIRIDGIGTGNITSSALTLSAAKYPMAGHKYEINYWMDSNTNARAAFSLIAGSPSSAGHSGRLGWTFRGLNLSEVRWYNNGTSIASVSAPSRDIVENKQYFKVILDGESITDGYGTLTLYVLSDGEYKMADQRRISYSDSSNFYFVLFSYDTIAYGEHMEIGGLTISEI